MSAAILLNPSAAISRSALVAITFASLIVLLVPVVSLLKVPAFPKLLLTSVVVMIEYVIISDLTVLSRAELLLLYCLLITLQR